MSGSKEQKQEAPKPAAVRSLKLRSLTRSAVFTSDKEGVGIMVPVEGHVKVKLDKIGKELRRLEKSGLIEINEEEDSNG